MTKPEILGEDDIHIWLAEPDSAMATTGAVDDCVSLLDADETRRYRSFRFDRDRQCFLAAHVLLRTTLSRYAPLEPSQWTFKKNAYGRPQISAPSYALPLQFNLSHTDGLVACAVTRDADVGIDVEALSRPTPGLDVAERFFSPEEYRMLRQAPASQQHELFFAIWTLKEAYIKARGMGLSLPLDQFAFDLHHLEIRGVHFRENLNDSPERWQFDVQRAEPGHILAFAVRRHGAGNLLAQFRRAPSGLWPMSDPGNQQENI